MHARNSGRPWQSHTDIPEYAVQRLEADPKLVALRVMNLWPALYRLESDQLVERKPFYLPLGHEKSDYEAWQGPLSDEEAETYRNLVTNRPVGIEWSGVLSKFQITPGGDGNLNINRSTNSLSVPGGLLVPGLAAPELVYE